MISIGVFRPNLDGGLSNWETAENQLKVGSLNLSLKKIEEVIALKSKEGIALTLDSRLSADFRQNWEKGRQRVDRLD